MSGISLDELAAIEPRVIGRSEAIDVLVKDFGLDPSRFEGLPILCVQLRLRQELNRRQPKSGLKLSVLEDSVVLIEEPQLVGVAS